jgi:SPP1 gp7 family putative phage head morphogenesis protein
MTTTSQIQRIVAKYRTDLLSHEAAAIQTLDQAHKNTLAVITPALDKLYDEMMTHVERGEQIPAHFLYEANRLEVIKRLIAGEIDIYAALAQTMTGRLQQDGIRLGLEAAMQLLNVQVPPGVSWSFGIPNPETIAQLIRATQAGSPLAHLFSGWGKGAADEIAQTLITGVTLGNNPRVVARSVRRIMETQAGQALKDSRNRALVLSRNELNRAARNASLETYRANSDVVTKYRRTCAKNSRTCAACIALDGTLYDLDTDFAIHPCDRCTPVPVTKSWAELLKPFDIDTSEIPDTRPQLETGASWFNRQSERVQRKILGVSGYKLWRSPNNNVTLQSFVTHKHHNDWGASIQVTPLKELVK